MWYATAKPNVSAENADALTLETNALYSATKHLSTNPKDAETVKRIPWINIYDNQYSCCDYDV